MTVGGTGKTPLTIYISRMLAKHGHKVAILTRGYRGSYEKKGGIVSDGVTVFLSPDEAGDEAYLMASKLKGIPVFVGKNRFLSGMRAVRQCGSDVLILDDGFQHTTLHRDVDLVLVDARHPFGNGFLVPKGTLREPAKHIIRADALVVTRFALKDNVVPPRELENHWKTRPVFFCRHEPDSLVVHKKGASDFILGEAKALERKALEGAKVLAFSGIGNNDDFLATVEGLGCEVLEFLRFSDHHAYDEKDVATIEKTAETLSVDCILTTEKDYVRVMAHTWHIDIYTIQINLVFSDGGEGFEKYMNRWCREAQYET
jgi:tetraacyldisaccharide 4'-kinase